MRMRILLQAGVLLVGAAVAGSAQSSSKGRIDLQISDKSGAPVNSASVEIDPNTPKSKGPLMVDWKGRRLLELAAGPHEIRVSCPCSNAERIRADVHAGETQSIHAVLQLVPNCVVPAYLDIIPVQIVPPGDYKPVDIPYEPLPAIHLKALRVKPHRFWHFWR